MSLDLGANGMFHKPLEGFCWPPMMVFPFITTSMCYLVNIATQSLSHSFPMEINGPDLRSSKMCPTCDSWESLVERGIVARVEGSMLAPFDTCT